MREIVFDTETTGLDPYQGDRLVEIGCVELVNGFPTGQVFHAYLNPQRDVPDGAFQVHGLSTEFLKDKALFADICEEFLAFVGDAPLVAHNAMFDLGFINSELERCKRGADPARPAGRHADAGAAALSGRAEQSRSSVRALFDRCVAPHQAWRAARCRAARRSLCRADRQASGAPQPCRRTDRRLARRRDRGRARAPGAVGAAYLG